jgi:hypothetical protein
MVQITAGAESAKRPTHAAGMLSPRARLNEAEFEYQIMRLCISLKTEHIETPQRAYKLMGRVRAECSFTKALTLQTFYI